MEKDFEEFIAKRCEKALLENREYLEKEHIEDDMEGLQEKAEILCYKKGFSDALKIFDKVNI